MAKKVRFAIIVAVTCVIALFASPCKGNHILWDENSPLVQVCNETQESLTGLSLVEANPEFVKIMPDLHFLVKRSYRSTKRNKNQQYEEVRMLEHDQLETVPETGHNWHCIRNFQGQQGTFVTPHVGWRIAKFFLSMFAAGNIIVEVDYPGFVAYRTDYDCNDEIIWLVIILRGSQGEDFQPFGGMLGSSWITNFSAGAANLLAKDFPFKGCVHSGYLNKMLACKISMKNSINKALEHIGPDNFHRVRFVVTGHSQGGGLAQIALPMIIKEFSYIYGNGQTSGNSKFENSRTPRFFGYFISAPHISCGKVTAGAFLKYVGKRNMIRHNAHGDIIPMLCLRDYLPLGVLAVDPFYDVFCRSIRSEIAHCSIASLFTELKNLFDQDKFDIDEESNVWTAKENRQFKIYWNEIVKIAKITGFKRMFQHASTFHLFKHLLIQSFIAANPPKKFEEPESFPDVSKAFIEGLMKEGYNIENIRLLIKDFSLFGGTRLDEKRKEKVFILSNQMEEWLGTGEDFGFLAASSCLNSLNAISGTANSIKGLDSKNLKIHSNVIKGNPSISFDTLSPLAGVSAVSIAHFGSHSNFYGTTLFDRNLPSKDINLALRNGAELLRSKKKNERCVFIYEEGLPEILVEMCKKNGDSSEDE